MPDARLDIALEHHRAGRVRQAEEGYRAILAGDPDDPDALHWLGVLTHQAGAFDNAIVLLERAARARPGDPAFAHNLAQAYLGAARHDDAVSSFRCAAGLNESAPQALVALGTALLTRHAPGDASEAVDVLRSAIDAGTNTPDVHHHLGVALIGAGRADDAIGVLRRAVAMNPTHASAHYHLGIAHRARGDAKEARKALNKALEADQTLSRAWQALAALDAEAGNFDIAAGLLRRAIKAAPDDPTSYTALAAVLGKAGRHGEAATAREQGERAARQRSERKEDHQAHPSVADLEQRLTPDPEAAQLHFALAAVANVPLPPQVPGAVVEDLFDRYAERFDAHLQGRLEYRVPEKISEAAAALPREKPMDVLDLGCGTGLCGVLLRPLAATLTGVDLSPNMIEKSRERGVYDRLELTELVAFLRTSRDAYDLLVAADVLIYIGDLAPIFEAASKTLRPGGYFAFSVEAAPGDRYQLGKRSRRFAHSTKYVRHVASLFGFEEVRFDTIVIRTEGGEPLMGYLVVLRASSRQAGFGA